MVLELNDREQEILRRALNTFEEELRTVILKTDKRDLRDDLRGDEIIVKNDLRV